jgi:hypothetical protein
MTESVYKVVELVGTSTESWEKAAAAAVALASKSLRDLRVATVTQLDIHIVDGKVAAYRARMNLSFKYESEEEMPKARPAAKGRGRAKAIAAPPPPAPEPEDDDEADAPAPKKGGARKTKRKGAKI